MSRWNCFKKLGFLFSLSGIIAGCATASFAPGTESVNIAIGSAPKNCQLRGDVNSGIARAPIASHIDVQKSQLTLLKSQAAKMGANVVFVTTHRTTYYPHFLVSTGSIESELDTHHMSGKAYLCSSDTLNQLNKNTSKVSDVNSK